MIVPPLFLSCRSPGLVRLRASIVPPSRTSKKELVEGPSKTVVSAEKLTRLPGSSAVTSRSDLPFRVSLPDWSEVIWLVKTG